VSVLYDVLKLADMSIHASRVLLGNVLTRSEIVKDTPNFMG